MNDGNVKPFEDMTRDELIAAATFWRSEYERVIAGGAGYIIYPQCSACGVSHDPNITCFRMSDGTIALNYILYNR